MPIVIETFFFWVVSVTVPLCGMGLDGLTLLEDDESTADFGDGDLDRVRLGGILRSA